MRTQLKTTLSLSERVGQDNVVVELEGVLLDYKQGEKVQFSFGDTTSWPTNIPRPIDGKYWVAGRTLDSITHGQDEIEVLRAYTLIGL